MSRGNILQSHPLGTVLVTGGSGGLANQILILLASRKACTQLHSVDLRSPASPISDVHYHTANLTDEAALRPLFNGIQPDVVIHCASPRFDANQDVLQKVNIEGTRLLVNMAKESKTRAFVYTSSGSVISDGVTNLIGADESYPLVIGDQQPEFYTHTKALAECYVLSQNMFRQDFRTCSIRPSGIFGVDDYWVLPGLVDAYKRGQTKAQLGDNNNLFDFTENTNVAHAHHLAAATLLKSIHEEPNEDERVDGEAFFITNDEPMYFWDFARTVWRLAGDQTQPHQIWVISRTWAMVIAGLLEWLFWLLRLGNAPLTRQRVRLSCMTRYFSVDKAKRRLGYQPLIGVEDGLKRAVKDCLERSETLDGKSR